MSEIILKIYLNEELNKYNYVLGSRLLLYFLNNLKILYSDDEKTFKLLDEFINFLISISDELENAKNGFNILTSIDNVKVIVDLLCFFNPSEYYHIRREILKK